MPSLVLEDSLQPSPSVLMAIDIEQPPTRRPSHRAEVHFTPVPSQPSNSREPSESAPIPAVRIKLPSRPRSYISILEDFNDRTDDVASSVTGSPSTSRFSHAGGEPSFALADLEEYEEDVDEEQVLHNQGMLNSPEEMAVPVSLPSSPSRREDTVRRRKRFSMPAVAIHTTPVTARPNVVGEGKSKRWSLVLGNLKSNMGFGGETSHGLAAGRLNELLGRQCK
jgi:FYVE, RhoGEF and PH domain containing 5/6